MFGELYRPLTKRLDDISDRVPALQAEIDVMRINRLSSEEVIDGARDLYSRWEQLSFSDKTAVIEGIVEQITVGDGDIDIHLHYVPVPVSPELADIGQRVNRDSSPQ